MPEVPPLTIDLVVDSALDSQDPRDFSMTSSKDDIYAVFSPEDLQTIREEGRGNSYGKLKRFAFVRNQEHSYPYLAFPATLEGERYTDPAIPPNFHSTSDPYDLAMLLGQALDVLDSMMRTTYSNGMVIVTDNNHWTTVRDHFEALGYTINLYRRENPEGYAQKETPKEPLAA